MHSERNCPFWSFCSNQTHRNEFLVCFSIPFKLLFSLDTSLQAMLESNDIYAVS